MYNRNGQRSLEETEAELRNTQETMEQIRRDWRQATADLNRLKSERSRGANDEDLMNLVRELQYMVRDWCIQHFDGATSLKFLVRRTFDTRRELLELVRDSSVYLKSTVWRPKIMQSLIWNQLCNQVFNENKERMWAGSVDASMKAVAMRLESGK